ncbi:hypothetical protein L249_7367 [Ophiocordyceps polyrhachis-furcata BCC 54312]|uniref:Uncharacterized protein n=1 Tax=Ophiocordyceps polyrhachis-furcata BCC 54312 TaxID=1330021 RepID=A0A367L9S4_9HYPO|nr:hypothetical protein L249_7367 [Ophiocordyceps polyrhachis-furcata BCC 54312]
MIWEGIHAQSPIGIVIAARELGKSDFLSVGHDFSMRKNVGKKWKVRKADADDSSKYFSRYFKVPTCSTLTYLYKIGDLEEDLYVPYPAVSAVLRGVWVRIRLYL